MARASLASIRPYSLRSGSSNQLGYVPSMGVLLPGENEARSLCKLVYGRWPPIPMGETLSALVRERRGFTGDAGWKRRASPLPGWGGGVGGALIGTLPLENF